MPAFHLAIAAGLLTCALTPGMALAARKDRTVAVAAAPQQLTIAETGGAFFIAPPRGELSAHEPVNLGSTVRIDQRLLAAGARASTGDDK